ncbi:hypothetical protein RhiirC2_776478 [Rhizophagus irregularis]|uniref:Uncharacterized protein n=1 Tax=Rhizophagus irregularis TaxID=588596 RepID=A0A2N1NGQ6_9GLOM|nr:hypothetical protein RhiirC2_776478 [Rhizophagus irregularis]
MILLPLDSSHKEESNGSKIIKFGAILAKLSYFETLVLIFNKLSQANTKPSYNCSLYNEYQFKVRYNDIFTKYKPY